MLVWHRSKIVKEWNTENGLGQVYGPTHSPDLNPIENVCSYVERQLQTMQMSFENIEENICSIWANIPVKYIQNWCRSMPKRMRKWNQNNGYPTQY